MKFSPISTHEKEILHFASAFFNLRVLLGFTLSFLGLALAIFAGKGIALRNLEGPSRTGRFSGALPTSPLVTCLYRARNAREEASGLARLEQYWNDRLTLSDWAV